MKSPRVYAPYACAAAILLTLFACSTSSSVDVGDDSGVADATTDGSMGSSDGSSADMDASLADAKADGASVGSDAAPDGASEAAVDAAVDAPGDGPSGDARDDSSGGDAGCSPTCGLGLTCCNGSCIDRLDDIDNCGSCGHVCGGPNPYCDNGICGAPPCEGAACTGSEFCCGTECCAQGMLCCHIPSNVITAPACTAPVDGTCPVGCPLCP